MVRIVHRPAPEEDEGTRKRRAEEGDEEKKTAKYICVYESGEEKADNEPNEKESEFQIILVATFLKDATVFDCSNDKKYKITDKW